MAGKGAPKSGGRQKGTPNKKTKELQDLAEKHGVNPFEILLLFAKGDFKKLGYDDGEKRYFFPALRERAAEEACQYLYPKRKAIEHSVDEDLKDMLEQMSDEQLDERLNLLLKKKAK